MDDRTQPGRERAASEHSAPSTPNPEDHARVNGRHEPATDRSSSSKPALTDRERQERWPVD